MNPESIERYQRKAAIVAAAWQKVLGEAPTRHALVLAMAVAEFETRLGDATGTWRGEHNWGAIHKRALTPEEASVLMGHGIYATGDDALRTARGLLIAGPNEALHIDKGRSGPYFAWFWAFDNDTDGAAKFLDVLVRRRAPVRLIIDSASTTELAAAMYSTHYFEGTSSEPGENIRAYAARLEAYVPRIETALLASNPPGLVPPSSPSLEVPSESEARAGAGWWLAGFALLGVGALFLGRRP
jgi:hypothetical protein